MAVRPLIFDFVSKETRSPPQVLVWSLGPHAVTRRLGRLALSVIALWLDRIRKDGSMQSI